MTVLYINDIYGIASKNIPKEILRGAYMNLIRMYESCSFQQIDFLCGLPLDDSSPFQRINFRYGIQMICDVAVSDFSICWDAVKILWPVLFDKDTNVQSVSEACLHIFLAVTAAEMEARMYYAHARRYHTYDDTPEQITELRRIIKKYNKIGFFPHLLEKAAINRCPD